ncbi:MAG: hypothetical protein OXI38_03650 [Bacteroidota bacterium]|nr:hypothetical protein [Bacteroidota bacterium]
MADVELDGIGTFNLILGANSVGKTSLLEAIFLLTGPTNIQLPSVVQSARQLDAQSIETLESLFRNLNTRSTIELSATMRRGGGTRWLKISARIIHDDSEFPGICAKD